MVVEPVGGLLSSASRPPNGDSVMPLRSAEKNASQVSSSSRRWWTSRGASFHCSQGFPGLKAGSGSHADQSDDAHSYLHVDQMPDARGKGYTGRELGLPCEGHNPPFFTFRVLFRIRRAAQVIPVSPAQIVRLVHLYQCRSLEADEWSVRIKANCRTQRPTTRFPWQALRHGHPAPHPNQLGFGQFPILRACLKKGWMQ